MERYYRAEKPAFAGADTHGAGGFEDDDLAVTDLTRTQTISDDIHGSLKIQFSSQDFNF